MVKKRDGDDTGHGDDTGDGDNTAETSPSECAHTLDMYDQEVNSVPRVVGDYLVGRFIAGGGAGLVFEAEHRTTGQTVAIKLMRRNLAASKTETSRFLREIRIIQELDHPNIVRIEGAGELPDGRCYYVMERFDGPNLSSYLQRNGRLSLTESLAIIEGVVAGLSAAHQARCVHRDIKASNIIVLMVDGRLTAKLLDFGIAKLLQPESEQTRLTQMGQRLGSLHTMAPEQFVGGTITPATDIYALGVLLYRMLTNRYPFHSMEDTELEEMHLLAPPPRPSELAPVSQAVDAVVLRCLEKSAHARYASVGEFLDALRAAAATEQPDLEIGATALAIYTRACVTGTDMDDAHREDLLDQLDELIEALQAALASGGYQVLSSTHDSVLAVRPLVPVNELADENWEAMQTAHALYASARERVPAEIRCSVVVHRGSARVVLRGSGAVVVGGEVTRVATYCPPVMTEGVSFVGAEPG